jgi:Ca2+-binding EF-hand superfamily protein
VFANFGGKGRYFPGKIIKVNRSGTYNIEYDDGEFEDDVPPSLVRIEDEHGSEYEAGSTVLAKIRPSKTWEKATILRARPDGTYDLEFRNSGEVEKNVAGDQLRPATSNLQELRANFIDKVSEAHRSNDLDNDIKYRVGTRVACYWYKSSKFGRAREQQEPKSCIILARNSDGSYTVELEDGAVRLDDVPEDMIKLWGSGTSDLKVRSRLGQVSDPWIAVVQMARNLQTEGKVSERHDISRAEDLSRKFYDAEENLQQIFGIPYFKKLKEEFGRQDRYEEDEISIQNAVKGFRQLGRAVDEVTLNRYMSRAVPQSTSQSKGLNFVQFVQAFANLAYGSSTEIDRPGDELSQRARDHLRMSLRLNREESELVEFAKGFGSKLMKELQRTFDCFAKRVGEEKEGKISVGNLINAFHSMGKGITTSKISDWMVETDVAYTDSLTLADFASVYAFFFGNTRKAPASASSSISAGGREMSISEISLQILQSERWQGTADQVMDMIGRLTLRRPKSTTSIICSIRDSFEALDVDSTGNVGINCLPALLKQVPGLNFAVLVQPVKSFSERIQLQGRKSFALPELFEYFGPQIQEAGEGSLSVEDAFSLLALRNSLADVRGAALRVLNVVEKILENPTEPKYWSLNINNEDFSQKVWNLEGGKELLRSVGFGSPMELHGDTGSKVLIVLRGLENSITQAVTPATSSGKKSKGKQAKAPAVLHVSGLPTEYRQQLIAKRTEIEAELAAIDGAPTVTAAVRMIREKHSVSETVVGLSCALTLVNNLLLNPKDLRHYRVKTSNAIFSRELGRLHCSSVLMQSVGFVYDVSSTVAQIGGKRTEDEPAAYVFRSVSSKSPLGAEDGTSYGSGTGINSYA